MNNLSLSLLSILLLSTASVASADDTVKKTTLKGYTTFEYSSEHNRDTDKDNIKGNIVVGLKDSSNGMDYSFSAENSQAELGNGNISGLYEVRVKKTFSDQKIFNFFTPSVGVRLGERITNKSNFLFYAFDAGVKFPIEKDISGNIGMRYRNAFDEENFETFRVSGGVNYAVTDNDSVGIGYNTSFGDEGKNAWTMNYTRSF